MKFILILLIFLLPVRAYSEDRSFADLIIDTDRQVNTFVSSKSDHFDDALHFTLGAGFTALNYWLLGYIDWFDERPWWRRAVASITPLAIFGVEEAFNVHPDFKYDMPPYFVGAIFSLSLTF